MTVVWPLASGGGLGRFLIVIGPQLPANFLLSFCGNVPHFCFYDVRWKLLTPGQLGECNSMHT
jgi:hypothetical protein